MKSHLQQQLTFPLFYGDLKHQNPIKQKAKFTDDSDAYLYLQPKDPREDTLFFCNKIGWVLEQ